MTTETSRRTSAGRGRRSAVFATVTTLMLLGGGAALTQAPGADGVPPATASGGWDEDRVTQDTPPAEGSARPSAGVLGGAVAGALDAVASRTDAAFSVGVLDTASGASMVYGDRAYDTASIVKVDILATLLLQAQDAGRGLTAREHGHARAMIERSDNDSATELWRAVGGADGLDAANERLGLERTSGGDGGFWGLTKTTASDQLRLLGAVFADRADGADGAGLNAESRAYIQRLMGGIADGQGWGVSAAADRAAGGHTRLKNGWLPRSTTGRWDVNSIGRVTAGGHTYLLAVLSDGSEDFGSGVDTVERASRAAVRAATHAISASSSP